MTIAVTGGYQTYANFIETVKDDPASCLRAMVNGQLWLVADGDAVRQVLGAIPTWIKADDPTPITEQINRNYLHGGGWDKFDGFEVRLNEDNMYCIKYPGDPEYREIARGYITRLSGASIDMLIFFQHSWVMAVTFDENGEHHEIARID